MNREVSSQMQAAALVEEAANRVSEMDAIDEASGNPHPYLDSAFSACMASLEAMILGRSESAKEMLADAVVYVIQERRRQREIVTSN